MLRVIGIAAIAWLAAADPCHSSGGTVTCLWGQCCSFIGIECDDYFCTASMCSNADGSLVSYSDDCDDTYVY